MKYTYDARAKHPIKEMIKSTSAPRPKLPIQQMMDSVSNKQKTKKYKPKNTKKIKLHK